MNGLLFEEKLLGRVDLNHYIDILTSDSIFTSMEIGFSEEDIDRKSLKVLEESGIPMSFHIPYHKKNKPYNAACLRFDPEGLKQATEQFITFSRSLSTLTCPTIVAHLSSGKNRDDNLSYIDYILNLFERLDYPAILALENLFDEQICYTTQELETYIKLFNTPNLTLCLDIPNHHLSREPDISGSPGHLHFHGFDQKRRHIGLDDFAFSLFNTYREKFPQTTAVFELLDHPDYLKSLTDSLALIKNNTI